MIFDINSSYGKRMNMMEKSINATVKRREVIADNIANADTPGFKRSDVTFESQLQRAVESEKAEEVPTLMTDPRHMSFNETIDYRTVQPKIQVEYDSNFRNDKNNVDIDKEMAESTKNAMQYNMLIEVYSRHLRSLDLAMR
jgi:flagellar basal-body rod protein FlgB